MQPVIGELDMVTDGEKAGGDGFFIELGPGPQWVQVDLGAPQALHAILAWHYHSQARVYRDVIVQISNDAAFKTGVTTVFNNDHDNSSKIAQGKDKEYIEVAEGKLFDPQGADRPVRPALLEREHDQRPEPLRGGGSLRQAREMTRAGVSAVVAIALTAALALRLARLDVRPMHHDEANQAVKFGTLLEHGEYRYDAHDHHGPTLYYLSLPAAWLRGQFTLASLDEHTLRGVTAVFGTATILLLPLLSDGIGRTAVAAGAILMALSPAMVFYSRMFIQESLFTCFALAFVIAIGRVTLGGGLAWSAVAGLASGLAVATKETSAIVLPAALLACTMAWWSLGAGRPRHPFANGRWRAAAVVGLAVAAATAALFYSSFFASPGGVLEPFRGAGTYLGRGLDPADHAHAWHYYFGLLAYSSSGGLRWSEGLALVLAFAGGAAAWRGGSARPARTFWARYLAGYVAIAATIFSAIPYKTPWNLLPFYAGLLVLAGIGFSHLVHATRSRALRGALVGGVRAGGRKPRIAGLARIGDLRRRSTEPLRLRPDRSGYRAHGRAHPRARRHTSRSGTHAGVGGRASIRAVAAPVVSPGDAARRLLDRAGRSGGPPGACHRRVHGAHRRTRRITRRSLRLGILRAQA